MFSVFYCKELCIYFPQTKGPRIETLSIFYINLSYSFSLYFFGPFPKQKPTAPEGVDWFYDSPMTVFFT